MPQISYGKLVERIVTFGSVPETGPKSVDEALAEMGLVASDLPWDVLQGIKEQVESADNQTASHEPPSFLPMLVEAAGIRQKDISLPLRTPVLVAGDMSASMQVSDPW